MAALVWGAWGAEWAQNKKVAFNGLARTITVNSDVTALNLQTDVWSRWVDWCALPGNDYHTLAMRRTGYDSIPGGRSGLIYFLQNGWKLIIDMNKVRVTGVLYSDDFETAYWAADGQPIYPATVSALVNNSVSYQNVVTGTALTQEETAAAVWSAAQRSLTESLDPGLVQIVAAVVAALQAAPLPVNMVQVKGQELSGTGSDTDPWGPGV
jgi:hypothetical protein